MLAFLPAGLAMPVSERASMPSSPSFSLELDPLLSDLVEKKLRLKINVAFLIAELNDARNKLASQGQLLAQESETRKAAESKEGSMEEEVRKLRKLLEDKDEQQQLPESLHGIEQYEQNNELQFKAGCDKDNEIFRVLPDVSPEDNESINKSLNSVGEDVARLRDDVKVLSAQCKHKMKELELQLEMHQRTGQELRMRVLNLEFCLQESRSEMRKFQRAQPLSVILQTGEKRDKTIKELRYQVAEQHGGDDKQNFWEKPGFKMIASMSMLALVILAKR